MPLCNQKNKFRSAGKFILSTLVALTVFASSAGRLEAQTLGRADGSSAAVPTPTIPAPPSLPGPEADSPDGAERLTSAEIYQKVLRGSVWVVMLDGNQIAGHGTGWVLDVERRLIVTNHHVIGDSTKSVIAFFPVFEKGELNTDPKYYTSYVRPVKGTVVDSDTRADLALVQLESMPEGTIALEMADKSPLPGERLHAVGGVPEGSEGVWTYTWGVVRQVNRGLMANGQIARIVQAQLGINRGNSGGAVVNDEGKVVAVVQGFKLQARDVTMNIDITEVRDYLTLALRLVDPQTAADFHGRGERHVQAGRTDHGIKDFTAAVRLDVTFARAYAGRGAAFLVKGDQQTALADFEDAIRHDAGLPEAYRGRGLVKRTQGKLDEALQDLTTAIRFEPDSWVSYNQRGITYYQAGKFALAVEDFTRAIGHNRENATLYGNRGDALQKLGKHDVAVTAYTEAIALRSEYAYCYFARGVSFRELRKYAEAIADFDRAIRLEPKTAVYYFQRGLAKKALGSEGEAVADFNRAAELDPKSFQPVAERTGGRQAQPVSHQSEAPRTVAPVAGRWRYNGTIKGLQIEMIADLNRDGSYAITARLVKPDGESETIREVGNYYVSGNELVFDMKLETGVERVSRRFWLRGRVLWIHFQEIGQNIGFTQSTPSRSGSAAVPPSRPPVRSPAWVTPPRRGGCSSRR